MNNYALRRRNVLAQMPLQSALLLSGSEPREEASSVQNSDFYYLTGCKEPHTALLLLKGRKRKQILFARTPNEKTTLWDGSVAGPAALKKNLGMDEVYATEDIEAYLSAAFQDINILYLPLGSTETERFAGLIKKRARQTRKVPFQLIHSDSLLASMRLIKDETEIRMIRQATDISMGAHLRVKEKISILRYEYEAEAEILYHYRFHNAQCAFPPIVAAGSNSCILHYMRNEDAIRASDCLLIDSGARYEHYAADITRTHSPKRNTEAFVRIHSAVLKALKASFKSASLGSPFSVLHRTAVRTLAGELIRIGILSGTVKQVVTTEAYKRYFPHQTSHWIGLDVHDTGSYEEQELKAGMVFSIEPGLYFRPDDETVAHQWRGIGVRLEDTILMTKGGAKNLSETLPY